MRRFVLFGFGSVAAVACSSFDARGVRAGAGRGGAAGDDASGGRAGAGSLGGDTSGSGASAGAPSGTSELGGAPAGAGQGGEAGGAGASENQAPTAMLELGGDIQGVHDPSLIRAGDAYYLFSTGFGIEVRSSPDLHDWSLEEPVFASKPSWITTTDPAAPNQLWAPEVLYFGGKYHLYYSASRFGENQSCIGHATTSELGPGAAWVDQGQALLCSTSADNWNAIDPAPVQDHEGKLWLAFGSFWSGIKLVRLDADGKRDGPDFFSLATRNNTAVEAPHIVYRAGRYYLFESVDSCCQGENSTYKIMVGRANAITGPYDDRDETPLLSGGGTLVLQGDARYRGPGHNAILALGDEYYNVYHAYDAEQDGVPTLRIAPLRFDAEGWPISLGP